MTEIITNIVIKVKVKMFYDKENPGSPDYFI